MNFSPSVFSESFLEPMSSPYIYDTNLLILLDNPLVKFFDILLPMLLFMYGL